MKLVVRYSSAPPYLPMAVGDSFHNLAKVLGISASAISHAVHRNSELYKIVEVEEDPVLYPDNNGGDSNPEDNEDEEIIEEDI